MTTLADVRRGDVFFTAVRCTAADQQAGLTVGLYGPHRDKMADGQIATNGALSGQLTAAANTIPVQLITGLTPVDVGDVMENPQTGETAVVRWTQINVDGTVLWSSAVAHRVLYNAASWNVIGHVDLLNRFRLGASRFGTGRLSLPRCDTRFAAPPVWYLTI